MSETVSASDPPRVFVYVRPDGRPDWLTCSKKRSHADSELELWGDGSVVEYVPASALDRARSFGADYGPILAEVAAAAREEERARIAQLAGAEADHYERRADFEGRGDDEYRRWYGVIAGKLRWVANVLCFVAREEASGDVATLPLPVAMRNEQITERDFNALCDAAQTTPGVVGRLRREASRIAREGGES